MLVGRGGGRWAHLDSVRVPGLEVMLLGGHSRACLRGGQVLGLEYRSVEHGSPSTTQIGLHETVVNGFHRASQLPEVSTGDKAPTEPCTHTVHEHSRFGVLHQLSNTTCLSKDSITGAHHVFAGNMRTRFVPVQLVQPLLILVDESTATHASGTGGGVGETTTNIVLEALVALGTDGFFPLLSLVFRQTAGIDQGGGCCHSPGSIFTAADL